MGMKEIQAMGKMASALIEFGLEINRIENVWGGKYDALRTLVGKDLALLTDAEITTMIFKGNITDATTMSNCKLMLKACENMIKGIRQIKNALPANDL